MTGILDRLEDGFAAVELEEGGMQNIPLETVPAALRETLREGQVLHLEGGTITAVDEEATARRAAAIRRRFERLKHRKKD